MAKKPTLPLNDVRSLTIREIVHLWRREAEFHPKTLERELRRFVLNHDLNWQEDERIDPNTPDDALPPPDTLVSQEWLRFFCLKKDWVLPTFWFPPDPTETPRPGRPSNKTATVQEFQERAGRGETETTISAEARAIKASLEAKGVANVPQQKAIEGHIRPDFNAHRQAE